MIVFVGASTREICGVRDCAATLARALDAEVETFWSDGGDRARTFARAAQRARELGARAIVWHYSVFSYGKRGLPYDAPSLARRLRGSGVPLVTFLHELVYPFGVRGLGGAAQALATRAVLRPVVAASDGVVLTTEARLAELERSCWLPRRPAAFLPIPSNLVPPVNGACKADARFAVFGYGSDVLAAELVAAAVADVRREGIDPRLVLLGAPGPASEQAERWRRAAEAAGIADALEFTGVLPDDALAHALADVDVVLFADPAGPTSRRTTIAASLAFGKPLVALDGPQRWQSAVGERALVTVEPRADAVARALATLVRDDEERAAQSQRARSFYARAMSADVVARRLLELVDRVSP